MNQPELELTLIFCFLVWFAYLCYRSRNERIVELKREETMQQAFELLERSNELLLKSNTVLAKAVETINTKNKESIIPGLITGTQRSTQSILGET